MKSGVVLKNPKPPPPPSALRGSTDLITNKVVEFNLEGFHNDLALNNAQRGLAGEVTVLNVYPEKYSVKVRCGNATSFMSAMCFGRLEKVGKVIVN